MFRKTDTHVHFVGIGGIGMSGIAEVLLDLGYRVTGTDLRTSETTARLGGLGARIHLGHRAEHLGDADVVVISSAVGRDNPEVLAARAQHIPVIPRAEMLAELMRLKVGIAIAGSHGKTTTTSIIASVLHRAGLDPTVVIGGKVHAFGSNARRGRGEIMVCEADESDGSFLLLAPTFTVVTNVDAEHLDHYGDEGSLRDAFVDFANHVPFYGASVLCVDDPAVRALLPRIGKRVVTYGLGEDAELRGSDVRHEGLAMRFHGRLGDRDLGEFELRMPGEHNVRNALAAIAVCEAQEVPLEVIRAALSEFAGVERRFTVLGEARDVLVVDDYGHHPTEIAATLAGARRGFPGRRVVAVLQPHRYTRLRDHLEGFARALDLADVAVLTDVYPAGEAPIAGVDLDALAECCARVRPRRPPIVVGPLAELPAALAATVAPGDVVVTLGAGSVTTVGPLLLERLRDRR